MYHLIAVVSGILFGLGLAISQMIDPAKVLSFLDVTGAWDPSLMLVMGGALAVTIPGFRWILKRPAPVLDGRFHLPERADLDLPLVLGAALFGLGWGLSGLCPGPAVAGLVNGLGPTAGFVVTMLLGYRLMDAWERMRAD